MALPMQTGTNPAHDAAVQAAHNLRQNALAAATTQAAAISADITFYRAVLASAVANGLAYVAGDCQVALASLGTGGR